ncbi:MAG: glutamate--tRNA ligase [Deltaproteobacteria bacterium]|nr:glutamate--tRNA ligase [Deltaproteobacteria bacterium]MBW1931943.1 glutamate--tRNA ligase [Deltaproteobacteria bacterium]MBW1937255.1 glutamate--tRNA ligase [Deltaproteobacteria bacterium]MBW2350221.1 glutamate--tRNA ligase [Deltaproteobacteria bacterium]
MQSQNYDKTKDGVRVRFAPSPTGYLHIGGARTAIYNWLFAKKYKGVFILRIEDTDLERSTTDSIQGIIDGLHWLGIDLDEGPYFQSKYIEEHKKAAEQLVDSGHAYKCFCTKEELDVKRRAALAAKQSVQYDRTCRRLTSEAIAAKEAQGLPYVIRFKVPEQQGAVCFNDAVYGPIEKQYQDIEDFVIMRSDGSPLYLLSNAVDDIRDKITHVIRGQDGLANTPRQILMYKALGARCPVFAHMPLTLDLKKRKISKRTHGELVSVQFYRNHGFLPWALVNFLVLLGWHTSDDREIFSREELIDAFSLEGIGRANSIFNYTPGNPKFFTDPKALSINSQFLRTLPIEEIAEPVKEEFVTAGIWDPAYDGDKKQWLLSTLDLIRSRFHTFKDFADLGRAYFSEDFPVDPKAFKKRVLKYPDLKELMPQLADRMEQIDSWTLETTEKVIRDFAQGLEVKPGIIINAIRTAVTGQLAGPGIFDVLTAIGKDRVVKRLRRVSELFGEIQG